MAERQARRWAVSGGVPIGAPCIGVRWADLQAMASALKASAPAAFAAQYGAAPDGDALLHGMIERSLIRRCARHDGYYVIGSGVGVGPATAGSCDAS